MCKECLDIEAKIRIQNGTPRCTNCGGGLFETDPLLSEMEGQIIWSHDEDTKCDDPKPEEV